MPSTAPSWRPPAGTPAAVASCAQGLDPERSARVPCGSGHRRPGGQDHPGRDRVPQGICDQGDDCHEGHHGGHRPDTGAPGVLPAPGYAAKRYPAPSPLGGPPGCPSVGQRAPACPTMGRPPTCVSGPATERGGVGTHHRLAVKTTGGRVMAMGPGITSPPGQSHRGDTTVAVDSHRPGCGGELQVPRGVCGTQVPGAPAPGAPILLAQHGEYHLYATILEGRLSPASAIRVATKLSHWITDLNVRVDATTPEMELTWLLRRPFSFLPPVTYRDQCQLSPTALSN